MKQLFSSIALVFVVLFSSFIQKNHSNQAEVWEELEAFHLSIALTFHPAEDGDFEPIKNDSDELVEAAQNLLKAKLPAYFEKKENENLKIELQAALQKLVKQSINLHTLVEAKTTTDATLLEELNSLHSTYHHIEELNNKAKKSKFKE